MSKTWGTIEVGDEGYVLDGETLKGREHIELKLGNGKLLPAEWDTDPIGRIAVYIQVQLGNEKKFKVALYLPAGVKARRVKK